MNTSVVLLAVIGSITNQPVSIHPNSVLVPDTPQSKLLVTQPASTQPLTEGDERSRYSKQKLNAIADSIHPKPTPKKEPSLFPPGLVDMKQSSDSQVSDPSELFKLPPLDMSIKLPVSRY